MIIVRFKVLTTTSMDMTVIKDVLRVIW